MTAKLINGNEIAQQIREELKQETPMLSNICASILRYSLSEVSLDQYPQNRVIL